MAGPTIALSAAVLRSSGLELYAGAAGAASRTKQSSTRFRKFGRWPPMANYASRPNRFHSPRLKALATARS